MKLGKHPVRHDMRTLMLRDVMPNMPAPPMARDWSVPVANSVGLLGNDTVGNCTIVALANLFRLWSLNVGPMWSPTLDDVMAAYSAVSGYVPGKPETDNGADMLTVLNYARNVGIGGRRIGGFAKIDHTDPAHVEASIDFFGGVYVGADLPKTAQNLAGEWKGPTTTPTGDQLPGSWGGHAMGSGKYDRNRRGYMTWGQLQDGDRPWWDEYVTECYVIFAQEWVDGTGSAPVGLPVEKLRNYLAQLAS